MEQTSSRDETTVKHQFDRMCKLVLRNTLIDHKRQAKYLQDHEILFSSLSSKEQKTLCVVDEYALDICMFHVLDYEVEVKNSVLSDAIKELPIKKQDVILMAYFLGMSDAEIARQMKLVRSTVHEHRRRSLELLKVHIEGEKHGKKN